MSRRAYLDCVGGLAGDMLLAALLDAGANVERLHEVPALLGLAEVEIRVERVERHGISALNVHVEGRPPDRDHTYRAIRARVESSGLPPGALGRALVAVGRLAEAESRVHGVPADEVHFHELGDVDMLVDVCGAMVLLEDLRVGRVACSPLPFSRGLIESAHGLLPSPAPAALELLEGAHWVGVDTETELVTPTGAAIAATITESWGPLPPLTLEAVGYGAGSRDLRDRPNLLRVVLGAGEVGEVAREVSLLETNIDDLNPEFVPDAVERCLQAGALDVWTAPVQMKKGRPGIVLSVLARPAREAEVARVMLEETSALGVRLSRLRRYELEREETTVEVAGRPVRVKLGRLDGRVVNVAPEHDDCADVAQSTGTPVKSVWLAAVTAIRDT